jgi:recombination protein RecT
LATQQDAKKAVATANSGGNQPAKTDAATDLIERLKPAMAKALPSAVPPEWFARVSLTLLRRQPELLKCSQQSLMGGLMQAAQLGLEPGPPLGLCWLVPFWDKKTQTYEVTFILGYTGLIRLARRSGSILKIEARVVYENDHFAVSYGLNERLDHDPVVDGDRGKFRCVYALAEYVGGGHNFVVLSKADVDKYRERSKSSQQGPWVTDYAAMAEKTAVRRLRPFLPMSIEMQTAFAADETARLYSGEDNGVVDVAPADAALEPGGDPEPEPDGGDSPANDAADGPGNGDVPDAAPAGDGGNDGEPDPAEPDADAEAARQEQLGAAS